MWGGGSKRPWIFILTADKEYPCSLRLMVSIVLVLVPTHKESATVVVPLLTGRRDHLRKHVVLHEASSPESRDLYTKKPGPRCLKASVVTFEIGWRISLSMDSAFRTVMIYPSGNGYRASFHSLKALSRCAFSGHERLHLLLRKGWVFHPVVLELMIQCIDTQYFKSKKDQYLWKAMNRNESDSSKRGKVIGICRTGSMMSFGKQSDPTSEFRVLFRIERAMSTPPRPDANAKPLSYREQFSVSSRPEINTEIVPKFLFPSRVDTRHRSSLSACQRPFCPSECQL